MTKKINTVKITTKISKTAHDDLTRYCKDKDVYQIDVIEAALNNFFHPFDEETHEKYNKMQLGRQANSLAEIKNMLSIIICCHEEFVKTYYRNTPVLEFEDRDAKIAMNVRLVESTDNFLKRVMDSTIGMNPNFLSAFNITKEAV